MVGRAWTAVADAHRRCGQAAGHLAGAGLGSTCRRTPPGNHPRPELTIASPGLVVCAVREQDRRRGLSRTDVLRPPLRSSDGPPTLIPTKSLGIEDRLLTHELSGADSAAATAPIAPTRPPFHGSGAVA